MFLGLCGGLCCRQSEMGGPLAQQRGLAEARRGGDQRQLARHTLIQSFDQAWARDQACPEPCPERNRRASRRVGADAGNVEFGGQRWHGRFAFPGGILRPTSSFKGILVIWSDGDGSEPILDCLLAHRLANLRTSAEPLTPLKPLRALRPLQCDQCPQCFSDSTSLPKTPMLPLTLESRSLSPVRCSKVLARFCHFRHLMRLSVDAECSSQITLVIVTLCSKPLDYFGLHFHSYFHCGLRHSPFGRSEKHVGQ